LEKLDTISYGVKTPNRIQLVSSYKFRKDGVKHILKIVMSMEPEMIEIRVWQGPFEST
jgi:hypothetical protein